MVFPGYSVAFLNLVLDVCFEIGPEKAAHALNGVREMVGSRDIEGPVEAFADEVLLHVHYLLEAEPISSHFLDI